MLYFEALSRFSIAQKLRQHSLHASVFTWIRETGNAVPFPGVFTAFLKLPANSGACKPLQEGSGYISCIIFSVSLFCSFVFSHRSHGSCVQRIIKTWLCAGPWITSTCWAPIRILQFCQKDLQAPAGIYTGIYSCFLCLVDRKFLKGCLYLSNGKIDLRKCSQFKKI